VPRLREKKQELVRNFNRSAIYDAAVDLFKEYGFNGFTMQQVAEKSGVAIGTLYNCFTNKEQIIRYVGDTLFEKFFNSITEVTQKGNAIEKMEQFSKCFFEFGVENRALIKLFDQVQMDTNRHQKFQRVVKLLQDIIKSGMAKNELRKNDPEKSALYFLSLLIGYNNHVADSQDFDSEKESKEMIAFLKPYLIGCE
jgi:AcrR family transcriptional regulator